MPQYQFPPDAVAVNQFGHLVAHDYLADFLALLELGNPLYYGADPTGNADSSPAFNNAIAAVVAANPNGGIIPVSGGTYRLNSTVTDSNNAAIWVQGVGHTATVLNYYGSGDCFRSYNSFGLVNAARKGGIAGLTIDGTNHTGTATGVHVGDRIGYRVDVDVRNFGVAGDIGVHADNTIGWTEQCRFDIFATNCATALAFDVSGATTSTSSFARSIVKLLVNTQNANWNFLSLLNGARPYGCDIYVGGNTQAGASSTGVVLGLSGTVPAGHPGAGSFSQMQHSRLFVDVETNSGAATAQTINFGTPGSHGIFDCHGMMNFGQGAGAFAQSNIGTTQSLTFAGNITGDASLQAAQKNVAALSLNGPVAYGQGLITGSPTATLQVAAGDITKPYVLAASVTIALTGSPGSTTLGAPQRITLVIKQAAAGGPFTVTWPHAGSPTTASPTVLWAGGTPPTMTATASATDVYDLVTADGITWYGRATQNVS